MGYYIAPDDYARAEANGISAETLVQRVRVYGWDTGRAATQPIRVRQDRSHWRALAEANGITRDAFYRRINQYGWSLEQAASTPLISKTESMKRCREIRRKYPQEWIAVAAENGITSALFRERVLKYGWDYQKAATAPRMSHSESGRLGKEALLERMRTQ